MPPNSFNGLWRRSLRPNSKQTTLIHSVALGFVACCWLVVSWRRWATLEIDFGRELYVPWQLSQGAVLYRDVDDFYGPLSQYFNSMLFALFGPGIMVLVAANLVVLGCIVGLLYVLLRKAWNAAAALVGSVVFLSLFGFSNYDYPANYNYITPYAHEATHGMLVLLALTAVLVRWRERPSRLSALFAGLLFGLTLVLKAEITLAAGLLTATALAVAPKTVEWFNSFSAVAWGFAAVLPTLFFALVFAPHVGLTTAIAYASEAWLNVVGTDRFVADPVQIRFLGLDHPWQHLQQHLVASALALTLLTLVGLASRYLPRIRALGVLVPLTIALCALSAWFGLCFPASAWSNAGRALLGVLLCYVIFSLRTKNRLEPNRELIAADLRIFLAVLAIAMMARMVLNGRLFHFGFYQAAIAGTLVPAILVGEGPGWSDGSRAGRVIFATITAGLLLPGLATLSRLSIQKYQGKTVSIEGGRDRLLVESPYEIGSAVLLSGIAEALRQMPAGQSLLVLPEGQGLNYLARMRSPLAPFFFYSASTEGGREHVLVEQLDKRPPEWVVLTARDLTEYGIQRYGESAGHGKELVDWVQSRYDSCGRFGTDPLGHKNASVELFVRRNPPVSIPKAIDISLAPKS